MKKEILWSQGKMFPKKDILGFNFYRALKTTLKIHEKGFKWHTVDHSRLCKWKLCSMF